MPKCEIHGLKQKSKEINMTDMEPLQIAIITCGPDEGHVVFRTSSKAGFEVIDLTAFNASSCWGCGTTAKVKLLTEPLTITLSND